jgi:hypothetical protein
MGKPAPTATIVGEDAESVAYYLRVPAD